MTLMSEPSDAARDSLEHLQTAAHELLRAARSLLDAAEAVIDEPKALESIGDAFATVVRLVGAGAAVVTRDGSAASNNGEGDGGVQHIRVS
jgi:hypothetical protein